MLFQRICTFVTATVGLVAVAPSVLAGPLEPRQNQQITVTGVRGGVQVRKNIADLSNDELTVLLLGLRRFQAVDQNDPLSYFQIAGIHGQPYRTWNGFEAFRQGLQTGYCPHVSILFGPWHRPYLALFEQVLYDHCQAAVRDFPNDSDRQKYSNISRSLRLPYWDWAAQPKSGSVMPAILTADRITMRTPQGTQTLPNPLVSYTFHPLDQSQITAPWPSTVRSPTSQDASGRSQNAIIARQLDNNRVSIQQRVYSLFVYYNNFRVFGSDAFAVTTNQDADSLEACHDTIHALVGNGGHMSFVPLSSYDPIFWLHHAMVDRLTAMWQRVYPDQWVVSDTQLTDTWTIPAQSRVDENTPLTPFPSPNGDMWTSANSRDVRQFGYTYPDLTNNDRSTLVRRINQLYGSSAVGATLTKRAEFGGEGSEDTAPHESRQDTRREYAVNVKADKLSSVGSYTVYVFLGQPGGDNYNEWSNHPDFVGVHAVISSRETKHDKNVFVTGTVPLTQKLQDRIRGKALHSDDQADVIPYFKKKLNWFCVKADGCIINCEDVPGLTIGVSSYGIKSATSDSEFPTLDSSYQVHTDVTSDKKAGAKHDYDV